MGLHSKVYSFENLHRAFLKSRKHKGRKIEVMEFEHHLEENLFKLQGELKTFSYQPEKMKALFVRKPAKRTVSIPSFRDRIAQQALYFVLEPIFEKGFIFDSYAFRIEKGAHGALERFDRFKRKVSPRRFPNSGFTLKADIKNYYPCVNHAILISLIEKKVRDKKVILLIWRFLKAYSRNGKGISVGSPLSQLFANIYLNELDIFVKHILKEKFYLRYCDDFVILNRKQKPLRKTREKIKEFLKTSLVLEFNPDKTMIISTDKGIDLLGYKVFYHYRLLRRKNIGLFKKRLAMWQTKYSEGILRIEEISQKIKGWCEYSKYGSSYKLRKALFSKYVFRRSAARPEIEMTP